METETQVPLENNPAGISHDLEAVIKATVEKTIAGLLESSNFGRRDRDRSRSRSKDRRGRSRSGSRGRCNMSKSRGRRNRSRSRGKRDRSGSRGRRCRSGSREGRSVHNFEDYNHFHGPFRHHHFHHPPPWAFYDGLEMGYPFGRGKWGKFGRRFHKRFNMNEPNDHSNEDKENAEINKRNSKDDGTFDTEKELRNNFENLDVDDAIEIN